MRTLSDREKRTLRWAVVVLAVYLGLFYGVRGFMDLEARRAEYHQLVSESRNIGNELHPYETKVLLVEKLRENFQIEPAELSRASVVGEASAAIQKAAQSGGVQIGPIRESPGSAIARELATMTIEGTGQVSSVMQLIYRLETLGYPLVVESIQITPESNRPGNIKVVLQIVVLDYERWKTEARRENV